VEGAISKKPAIYPRATQTQIMSPSFILCPQHLKFHKSTSTNL